MEKYYFNPLSGRHDDLRDNPDVEVHGVSMPYVLLYSHEDLLYVILQRSGETTHKVLGKLVERVGESYDLSRGDAVRIDDGKGGYLGRMTRVDPDLERRILSSIKATLRSE